jgi:hypothetical protein
MRSIKAAVARVFWRSKKRKVATSVGLLLLVASGALAYYLTTLVGSTQTTHSLPAAASTDVSSALSLNYSTATLTPGQSVPYSLMIDTNQLTGPGTVKGDTVTVSTTPASCDQSWFTVTRDGGVQYPATYQPGHGSQTVDSGTLVFTDNGADQSACAGGTITLHSTLSP